MKTRVAPQAKPPKIPPSKAQWTQLLRQVVQRAALTKDPRLASFQQALESGQAEKILREHSIISERDLTREFPSPTK